MLHKLISSPLLLLVSLCLLSSALAQSSSIDRHVVPCGAGQRVCECRESADECEFTLVVEELQTFVSYELERPDTGYVPANNPDLQNVLTREEEGKPFYINATGYLVPSFISRDDDGDSDCVTFDEDFERAKCTVPITVDGMTYRPCIAVNGQVPGPTLVVYEGQVVIANLVNNMITETVSIHWHGMNQRNTPWMDGDLHVSQCPVGPAETFRYYFRADPTGTYWYHSHRITQLADGFFGGFIVKESAERRAMLEDTFAIPEIMDDPGTQTIKLHEWDVTPNLDRFTLVKGGIDFFPDKPLGAVPVPPSEQLEGQEYEPFAYPFGPDGVSVGDIPFFSGLINGKGRHRDLPYERSRLEVFSVTTGGVYRFRLIGAQSQYAYKFSIDEHNLTVIATDGYLIEPVVAQFVILHTGERYDFLLRANQPRPDVFDYVIRAETLEVDLTSSLPYTSTGNMAEGILHYNPQPVPRSTQYAAIVSTSIPFNPMTCGSMGGCTAVNCPFRDFHSSSNIRRCVNAHELRLLWPTPANELPSADVDPSCSDCEHFFNLASTSRGSINGRNMQFSPFPLQTQRSSIPDSDYCDINTPCQSDDGEACSCLHVRSVSTFNKTIRFVLSSVGNEVVATGGFSHPMHFHGHHFQVVDIGYGSYYPNNSTLRGLNTDVRCGGSEDPLCSLLSWNGSPPSFSISNKTIRKDTVIVPSGGYVVIHFISDNPGFWLMHCHIIGDLLRGMAVVINEVESRQNPAPEEFPTCGGFSIGQSQFYESIAFDPDGAVPVTWSGAVLVFSLLFVYLQGVLTGL